MEQNAFAPTLAEQGLPDDGSDNGTSSEFGDRAQAQIKALVGRTLKGQYRIDGVLGHGAMGLVFRGTQTALSKAVAIKMMRPDAFHTQDSRDRFGREATLVSKLLHPSITQVLDFGIEGDMPFLVMEFVDGKELTDVLAAEGPMPPTRAVAIIRQLASALEEAHRQGVVHRDIKPQNLRLMRYTPGGQVFLKVLDFGIAKQMDEAGKGKMTATGTVMGTPMYMAPEQAGGHKVDARADQYALGIVLYELLTGTVPFTGETLTGVLVSHLTKPPPPLPRQVPEQLQKVVMKLLAKSPADRFADMSELDKALAACEPACRDIVALAPGRVQAFVAGGEIASTSPSASQGRPMVLGAVAAGAGLLVLLFAAVFGPRLRSHKPTVPDRPPPTVTSPANDKPVIAPTPPTPDKNPPPPDKLAVVTPAVPVPPVTPPPGPPVVAADPAGKSGKKPNHVAGKPNGKQHSETASSPTASEGGGGYDRESDAAREKLDDAQKLLASGDGYGALELAKRAQSDGKYARTFRILTMANCITSNIGQAKIPFHNVAAADRKLVVKFCREHGKDLLSN